MLFRSTWDDALPGSPAPQEGAALAQDAPANVRVYPGADEVLSMLTARALAPEAATVRVEYSDPDAEAEDMLTFECGGRTFQEVFRCILEWQWVHLNMSNNELVAVAANDFVSAINPPDDIVDWLWNDVPDQHVARYLRGIPNPRARESAGETPDMTPRFNKWVEEHIVSSPTLWPYGPR